MRYARVIPHSDGAGVIDAVGAGVSQDRIGQRVWCYGAQSYRPFGTAAELVVVPADSQCPCHSPRDTTIPTRGVLTSTNCVQVIQKAVRLFEAGGLVMNAWQYLSALPPPHLPLGC